MNSAAIRADFCRRCSGVRPRRWARFALVALAYTLWVVWTGCWWLLLGLLLLLDIYITGYIPLSWWKKSKSGAVRYVMSWVDAIVYALVLVYFVFAFLGQNYQIPSSSLEKTLLTGDYLFVNKAVYGPRVPMTPVNFPLVHNELPLGLGKSYVESVQLPYHRLKGMRPVESGDIVVFNFPAGDTVMSLMPNPDYYSLVALYGREALLANPGQFGRRITRPVDRRENYVKRVVGLPGQRLKIVDGTIYIDGKAQQAPQNVQYNHFYQSTGPLLADELFEEWGIPVADRQRVEASAAEAPVLRSLGFKVNADGTIPPIYLSPMTASMVREIEASPAIARVMLQEPAPEEVLSLYPQALSKGWTRANYGGPSGLWIPRKGATLRLDSLAWLIYERPIRVYEGHADACWRDGQAWIDGKPASTYTFGMDYYFMMGDNRDNSLDSRYWGFVPEDHVVGTPWRVLVSFDKDKPLLRGGIRWNRVLRDANPDK